MAARGYKRVQEVTRGTGGYKGLLGLTRGYIGLGVTRRYRGFQGVTVGYSGLQKLQGVTEGYKGLQGLEGVRRFNKGYKKKYRITGG